MRGNDYGSIGYVVTGHGNGNLNFGWKANYVSEKNSLVSLFEMFLYVFSCIWHGERRCMDTSH